jgi:hypothetical protein
MDARPDINFIGAKRFKPIGVCIYCGAAGPDLSDEHIVPYALNGNWVLPKASCAKCAYITGQLIEQRVLRGELRQLGAALNFQTRNPAERPTFVRLKADGRDIDVPIQDCPILMPFIKFPVPGILDGREPALGINAIGTITLRWGPDPDEFAAERGIKELSLQSTVRPAEFARMIAKIGYSWVVARFGLESVVENLVSPVILGNSAGIGNVIGCALTDVPKPPTFNEHVLQPLTYKGGLSGEDRLLAVRIKLFADAPTPAYEVVLGRPAFWVEDLTPDFFSV